jgi:hypothetical protein
MVRVGFQTGNCHAVVTTVTVAVTTQQSQGPGAISNFPENDRLINIKTEGLLSTSLLSSKLYCLFRLLFVNWTFVYIITSFVCLYYGFTLTYVTHRSFPIVLFLVKTY